MKKIPSLIFLFFLVCGSGSAQFRMSARTGILETEVNEILWDKQGDDAQIISQLDWNTYAAPVISLNAEYKLADTFIFGLNGFYTIPVSYGIIEDYDYMNILSTGSTERTHYSKHDNELNNYWNAGIFLGAGGRFSKNLKIYGLFSFSYSYYCFTAYNGFRQYGAKIGTQNSNDIYEVWNEDIPEKPMEGKIITFEAQKYFLGLGTRIEYNPFDFFSCILSINLLPGLKAEALDTHHKRKPPYYYFDLPSELAFNSSLLLEYKLSKHNALNICFNFFASSVSDGKLSASWNKNNWTEYANQCGIKETSWRLLLGYSFIYE